MRCHALVLAVLALASVAAADVLCRHSWTDVVWTERCCLGKGISCARWGQLKSGYRRCTKCAAIVGAWSTECR